MKVKMKFKKQNYEATFEDVNRLLEIHDGTWKISIIYVNKRTGEMFKSGSIVWNPCLYYEVQNMAREIDKQGGKVLEVRCNMVNKIIYK